MKKNSDYPAFAAGSDTWSQPGLTKREYFAGLAMQGLLASCAHPRSIGSNLGCYPSLPQEAVEMADELLKQLDA